MTICAPNSIESPAALATDNFLANRAVLAIEQSWILLDDRDCEAAWVVGRDGSLTAKIKTEQGSRWLADCSLPGRAAAALLKSAQLTSPVTCFLAPFHSAALRCTLDRLQSEQAVIAVVPSESDLTTLLHCDDFALEIKAHRLWFVAGNQWAEQLKQLLLQQIGLAVPSQFLRLNVADHGLIQQLIDQAQIVITSIISTRAEQARSMHVEIINPSSRRLCVMTPMNFRLWQDEGFVLSQVAPSDAARIDTTDPAQASPLKLARSAVDAGMLLTPNLARADLPNIVPMAIPWFSWITNDRVPSFEAAGPFDQLLIVDPHVQEDALLGGWPASRVLAAAWPAHARRRDTSVVEVTVLAHTNTLEPSKELDKFSSHRVLWETIRREIADDPTMVLTTGVREFLTRRMDRFSISAESFPFDSFVHQLIVPAYGQAIVDSMIARRIKIRLFGDGWDQIERLKPFWAGPLQTRKSLTHAIDSAHALLHVWPTAFAHPIESLGVPVVHAISGRPQAPTQQKERPCLSAALLNALIG